MENILLTYEATVYKGDFYPPLPTGIVLNSVDTPFGDIIPIPRACMIHTRDDRQLVATFHHVTNKDPENPLAPFWETGDGELIDPDDVVYWSYTPGLHVEEK